MASLAAMILALGAATTAGDTACGDNFRPCVQKIRVGGPGSASARPNYDAFDHSAFDWLLQHYVDCRGQVCYQSWKADCRAAGMLQQYLVDLGQVRTDDSTASIQGQIAFYINAYNALVIWGILQEYPTASIQAHNRKNAKYRIFDDLEMWIDGDYLSLNAIEHEVLRKLGDFRIHFALVCAAKGCPKLRCEAYVPERLEEQLVENSLDFFSRSDRFHICRVTGSVKLSPILQWFREDFGQTDGEVLQAILPYLTCGDHDWVIRNPCAKLHYMGYNWALNDRCPTPKVKVGSAPYAWYAKVEPILRPWIRKKSSESAASAWITSAASIDGENASKPSPPSDPTPPKAIDPQPNSSEGDAPPPRSIHPRNADADPGDATEPPPPKAIEVKGAFGFRPGKAIRLYGGLLPRTVVQPSPELPGAMTAKPRPATSTR